jgi:5-formyltetrahydrofolate cyclo-ligase
MHADVSTSRQTIRQEVRIRRRELSEPAQHHASHELLHHLHLDHSYQKAQHIALYLAFDGELDTRPLIEYCWQQGKQVYLPILHPFRKGHLLFQAYRNETLMRRNAFNIAEPVLNLRDVCPLKRLEILFTPLVAFDSQGNRLGMGGGYYDRTLELAKGSHLKTIGLAHTLQHYEQLPTESWDMPLDTILTPDKRWSWSPDEKGCSPASASDLFLEVNGL